MLVLFCFLCICNVFVGVSLILFSMSFWFSDFLFAIFFLPILVCGFLRGVCNGLYMYKYVLVFLFFKEVMSFCVVSSVLIFLSFFLCVFICV